jgi:hypothetical protein
MEDEGEETSDLSRLDSGWMSVHLRCACSEYSEIYHQYLYNTPDALRTFKRNRILARYGRQADGYVTISSERSPAFQIGIIDG